ncbi:MAG: PAS domain S-box protein [Candidatus Firestonebacteria bacterium]|nr:PAS domain S-box protein [Candidatus Firestonebacteria bacterium]
MYLNIYIKYLLVLLITIISILLAKLLWGWFGVFIVTGIVIFLGYKWISSFVSYFQYLEYSLENIISSNFDPNYLFSPLEEFTPFVHRINDLHRIIYKKYMELNEESSKVQAIINNMEEGVIALDEKDKLILINPAAEKIFGIKKEDVLGHFPIEVIRNYELNDILRATSQINIPSRIELNMVSPVEKIFAVHCVPIRNIPKNLGVIAVLYEITEIRKLENLRTDFTANVSHELRTPLTSIKGYVETLLDGAIDDKEYSRKFLTIIEKHVIRLERLIRDILNLSRIENNNIIFKNENVYLPQIIKETWNMLKKEVQKNEVQLELSITEENSWIKGDYDYLVEVFLNLIENAIKFNKKYGKIIVKTNMFENMIKIEIIDTGIGIPSKDLPRICERFYRVDKSHSLESGGTGLGLSIVKHILNLHKSSLNFESREGEGTTVSFVLQRGQQK